MKTELSDGKLPLRTTPAAPNNGRFQKPYKGDYTAFRRNLDGKRCRYFHSCPAYFPLLKKVRGGYPGGKGLPGSPRVG